MTGIYKKFKSGTDIRGIGIGNGDEPLYMSDEFISKASAAFADFLSEKTGKAVDKLTVAIGHDPRLSAGRISTAVVRGLALRGVNIIDCSLSSTPAMFMAVLDLPCDGSVQMTASHHPGDRNGLKFFTVDGGLDSPDIAYILEKAENIELGDAPAKITACDHMKQYAAHLRSLICKGIGADGADKPLAGMRIMVDAGNGAGGFYASEVLAPLGADVSPSMNLEPDGNFPVYVPNPESSVMIDSAAERVKQTNADFGIVFDTDVDRAGCILSDGRELNRNRLVAMISAVILENEPGAVIVTDSVTSAGLTKFIEAHGGKHIRFKRGYKNVINKQIELNKEGIDCPLAIETSGHAAFRENYYLDDGAYLVTKLIIKAALLKKSDGSLESFISDLEEPAEELERRFKIDLEDFKPYGEKVIADLKALAEERDGWQAEKINYEGIRINTDKNNGDGWLLLRMSVHDPILVLNLESNTAGGTEKMLADVTEFLKAYDKLN